MTTTNNMTTFMAFLETDSGQVAASVLLGLGLAALFRKACNDNRCIVVRSPSEEELKKYYYKVDDECYKYSRVATQCDKKTKY